MPFAPRAAGSCEIAEGTVFHKIHPGTSFAWSPAEGASTTRESYTNPAEVVTSLPSPGSISFDVYPNDAMQYWRLLTAAAANGSSVTIRQSAGKTVDTILQGSANSEVTIAATGTPSTGFGTATFSGTAKPALGSEDAPTAPFEQGLILVVGTEALMIESITSNTVAVVRRFGAITSKVAAPDSTGTAPTAASDNDSWKLVKAIYQRTYIGVPSVPPSVETSTSDRTGSATVQLASNPTLALVVEA